VPGDQSAEVVAKGEAEIGVAQTSEIVPVAGAQLVGPLPGDLNLVTVFSAGLGRQSVGRRDIVRQIHHRPRHGSYPEGRRDGPEVMTQRRPAVQTFRF
jgi:hypothetical protein